MQFKGDEVVAEHQVRWDGAEELRIDPLFPEINKRIAISFGEFARDIALALLFVGSGKPRRGRKLFGRGHDSLFCRARKRKRKNGQVEGNENKGDEQSHEDQKNGFDEGNERGQTHIDLLLIEFGHAIQHG